MATFVAPEAFSCVIATPLWGNVAVEHRKAVRTAMMLVSFIRIVVSSKCFCPVEWENKYSVTTVERSDRGLAVYLNLMKTACAFVSGDPLFWIRLQVFLHVPN